MEPTLHEDDTPKLEVHYVSNKSLQGEELEKLVDADIEAFSTFFQTLGNDPVIRSEKAIIKTYLAYKLGVGKK